MPLHQLNNTEFGDYQTPLELAARCCATLRRLGVRPSSILEPTCGQGTFLAASLGQFSSTKTSLGFEINPSYVSKAREVLRTHGSSATTTVQHADFFTTNWQEILGRLSEPILVIGNPPWVTNAALGSIGSRNLPHKTNFRRHRGIDALTGKSNFDISEWMLIQLLERLNGRRAVLAMLCKTTVARKVLTHGWKHAWNLNKSRLYAINAAKWFDAAVDACFLVCHLDAVTCNYNCEVYSDLEASSADSEFGFHDGELVANTKHYEQTKHLRGEGPRWRSGIKHDCVRVMEFWREGTALRNGLSQVVELEHRYLYPLFKSSDVARCCTGMPERCMLVTQRKTGDDTAVIKQAAPKTWQYLLENGTLLDQRRSSIYQKRPRFSIFGVGDYSFARWKVAISGLHKQLTFTVVGCCAQKAIVLDDTCYFLPCRSKRQAASIARLLNSELAYEFFSSFVFWDAKRPITASLLQQLDLAALSEKRGVATSRPKSIPRRAASRQRFVNVKP